jgi:bleomycin hydrolase
MKNLQKLVMIFFVVLITFPVMAGNKKDKKDEKKKEAYQFTMLKDIPTTSVKNQYRSGTCWSFSATSFLETELIRKGKGEVDLSEMFAVRNAYSEKAKRAVRWHGSLNFGGGGAFHDVTWVFKTFGAIPEAAYSGLNYGEEKHVHGEMDALLGAYVKTVIKNPNKKLSTAWHRGLDGILDAYLGEVPETFTVDGKEYTPKSYAEYLDLNMDDYVEIGSYTHHPFYSQFILEVPDNWMLDEINNVPMEDMMAIIENAINNGYSVGWGADVSEKGFSWKHGVAIVPNEDKPDIAGMESGKWEKLTTKERKKLVYSFDKPVAEKVITQEMRQEQFDDYKTTDDHGMLLTGIAKDQNGNIFFKVKNSWSEKGSPYNGYFFASKAFVELKTIDFMVNKEAIPQAIKDKLGIK